MKPFRLGLFQQIYLRMTAIIAAALVALLAYSYIHQYSVLVGLWQEDLQQEADWLAAHSRSEVPHEQIAAAWSNMHDGVRLQIYDASGELLADSFDDAHSRALSDADLIEARAPRLHDPQGGDLVLSRLRPLAFADQSGLFVTTLILFLLAAALLWPLTQHVTATFARLSSLAARVAEGQFGASIAEQGDRDLRALIRSFNAMSANLQDAEQRNHRLLVDVSHEFRSPLARLTALIDTLQRHPDESPELIVRLRGELALLDRLTTDALTDARFVPDARDLQLEVTDLASWAEATFTQLSTGGLGFSENFTIDNKLGGVQARIDPQRMVQVLGNLVDNARKASMGQTDALIKLEADVHDGYARLRVRDNGPGIDEADMPFIFDRFYRAGRKPKDDAGSGLGLSIARDLVRAHDGKLDICAPVGGGVVAEICIPVWNAADTHSS